MKLVIGNKNYSSWSLRPWLLLDAFKIEFEEINVSLRQPGLTDRLKKYSDAARVPVLIDGESTIWDSLAICETISDSYLAGSGWPQDPINRSRARSITAEMHAGFATLRSELPMNCRARRKVELSESAAADIARIDDIWSSYAKPNELGEIRLLGEFSIADCFYAPVVMRFITYGIELSGSAAKYLQSMAEHPSLQQWVVQALEESELIPEDEAGEGV
jgi:glutathione S-transferase